MPATSEMQAISVTPTTSNSRDDSKSMTAHNSRNAGNSRSEVNNRMANTVGTPAKAGMLVHKSCEATACIERPTTQEYC